MQTSLVDICIISIREPTLDEVIKQEDLKYGNHLAMDAAFEIAKESGLNPDYGYTKDMAKEQILGEFTEGGINEVRTVRL